MSHEYLSVIELEKKAGILKWMLYDHFIDRAVAVSSGNIYVLHIIHPGRKPFGVISSGNIVSWPVIQDIAGMDYPVAVLQYFHGFFKKIETSMGIAYYS